MSDSDVFIDQSHRGIEGRWDGFTTNEKQDTNMSLKGVTEGLASQAQNFQSSRRGHKSKAFWVIAME